jgi:hypothetical protein
MSRLRKISEELLETALNAASAAEWTLFEDRTGGMHLIAGCELAIETLPWTRGATAAWQVRRRGERVHVEGYDGRERCCLEVLRTRRAGPALVCQRALYLPSQESSRKNSAASSGGVGLI